MACGDRQQARPASPDSAAPVTGMASDSDSVAPAAAAAPGSDSTMSPDVVGVTWESVRLTTPVEQVDVDAPDHYTIRFESDSRVAVKADCNRGMSRYTVSPDHRIALKPMALTRAMCPKGSLSNRFAKEVSRATSYFIKDGDLFLELPVDSGTLRFRRQA